MKPIYFLWLGYLLVASSSSFSQTWNGSVNSDWNTAGNWTPANVPTTSGNVVINNSGAPHHPVLAGDVNIVSLSMSAGALNLNGFALTCSGHAAFTGDSLFNGKLVATTFDNFANMHMGGRITMEKTGASNEFWGGKNKFYGDSLIIVWRLGALHLQNAGSSPDSIFGNMKVQLADDYSVYISQNSTLYVQGNLILDNIGNGTFYLNGSGNTVIAGNLLAQNFSNVTPNLSLSNVTTLGSGANGPFYSHTASIENCSINGNFTIKVDSNALLNIHYSSLLGTDNLLQAGNFDAYGNRFGHTGIGTTILRAASNLNYGIYMRTGNNKFIGNGQWETSAVYPGGITMQHNWYGPDTSLQNLSFILKGNSALTTNGSGHNYTAGNVIIDGQGASKWIEFMGGSGNDFIIDGSFTVKNFTPFPEPGIGTTKVILHNITASGSDSCGTFYCFTGDIYGCRFNGNFRLIADSSQAYFINSSSFLGADNLFQAGITQAQNSTFGQLGHGTTILRSALSSGSNYMRDGNNKFLNNVQWETYALYPGAVTIQQNFYGVDSCLGNMSFILKGNSALTTNSSGNNYVAGNLTIDGQGARKGVQFVGGAGNSFNVGGNFAVKNFTPFSEPGVGPTNVYLHNLYVTGSDTVGTFYCYTGNIQYSTFNGNINVVADSSQVFQLYSSTFLGGDNLFQAGITEVQNSQFGQTGSGTTILRSALNQSYGNLMRDGSNKFFNTAQWETYATYPGGVTIQQNFYGPDSCWGNMNFILKGNSALTTNGSGQNYVAGNVLIDGQGARKLVQFTGGTGNTFSVGGNFTVKNFTQFPEAGVGATNVYLRNLYVTGSDSVGTFYCTTGDITNCYIPGNLRLIADSAGGGYTISNSSLLGADNLFQGQTLYAGGNHFGRAGNGTTILRAANNVNGGVTLRDGSNTFFGDARVEAYAVPGGGVYYQQTYFGYDSCLGNLTVGLAGPSSANLGGNNLYLGKGLFLQNNGSGTIVHDNGASAIRFVGTDTSNYSFTGSGSAPSFLNIEMNRSGGLRLMSPLTYTGTLTLTRGIILSSVSHPLQIPNGAVVSAAWDSGYVDGPVAKTGNVAFTFPFGKNNIYAPISMTAPSSTTDVFTAQYFNHLAHNDGYDSTQLDVSLNHLSRKEYWTLNRSAGSSAVKVTLGWKTLRSGTVNAMNDLRVAHWNGTIWKDEGNGATTGTNAEGTVQSLNAISSFSPFTLASSGLTNPLPLRFISFDARLNANRTVLLKWKTANEIGNDHFEVERSLDGTSWIGMANISPDLLHEYVYMDAFPKDGINYYRIKEVDVDQKCFYTQIKSVRIQKETKLFIWPNPASTELHVDLAFANGMVKIMDAGGKVLLTKIISSNHVIVPVQQLKAGVYILQIANANETYVEKFLKE